MRFYIQVSKKDLEMLQELETLTGIGKHSIVSIGILIIYQWFYRLKS